MTGIKIHTSLPEGLNNKAKLIKRNAYGFHDQKCHVIVSAMPSLVNIKYSCGYNASIKPPLCSMGEPWHINRLKDECLNLDFKYVLLVLQLKTPWKYRHRLDITITEDIAFSNPISFPIG